MKIGVICPIGPLDRYGYQYNYLHTLESLSGFAERVYLCSTTRNHTNVDIILGRFENVEYISDETTWFELDNTGVEVFDIYTIVRNANMMLERCDRDNIDCAIMIHINQYVQMQVKPHLRRVCQEMVQGNRSFEWLYKKYQLGNRLFHADTRVPWILNLRSNDRFVFQPDSIVQTNGDEKYRILTSDYRQFDHVAVVDIPMELTIQDLEDVKTFNRFYAQLNPQASTTFDAQQWLQYYARKFNKKSFSKEPLDTFGQAIARNSRPDFISQYLLKQYSYSPINRRVSGVFHTLRKLLQG